MPKARQSRSDLAIKVASSDLWFQAPTQPGRAIKRTALTPEADQECLQLLDILLKSFGIGNSNSKIESK